MLDYALEIHPEDDAVFDSVSRMIEAAIAQSQLSGKIVKTMSRGLSGCRHKLNLSISCYYSLPTGRGAADHLSFGVLPLAEEVDIWVVVENPFDAIYREHLGIGPRLQSNLNYFINALSDLIFRWDKENLNPLECRSPASDLNVSDEEKTAIRLKYDNFLEWYVKEGRGDAK
jgi:hypothetical protein